MLSLYNTLTRKKEVFQPLVPGQVGLYVCGITVYDVCHLGHARSMVCFDVLLRFLRFLNYSVTYVRNITDIDDKIIVRAKQEKVDFSIIIQRYIESMHADEQALSVISPDIEPRATEYVPAIIRLIERLMERGHAYVTPSGDVCYEVASFPSYGKLAQKDLDGLQAGARVDISEEKRSPFDFVLWKKAKPGEPFWASPWGEGRPGWHIECSAMSIDTLGTRFDIHGGGSDLQFPHHENEIAQSEGATGDSFAQYWMHVGMLQISEQKMSKSLGNFFTIQDILKHCDPETLRYFLITNHYRSTLQYSHDLLLQAHAGLTRLYQSMKTVSIGQESPEPLWVERFQAAMADDLNTPSALAVLFELSRALNKNASPVLAATLRYLGGVLGILQQEPSAFLQKSVTQIVDKPWVEMQIEARLTARQQKNYALADEIRHSLAEKGILLEDTAEGTTWRVEQNV
ncbi:MAG: cysteine--tRNA ligase [Legionellaceae bacterium]|nr:cysteine--tRNA ligase [Legionellaceae bacterium]